MSAPPLISYPEPAGPGECDQWHFRVLGPLEVWHGQQRIRVGGRSRERVLAALLLEAGHSVPVARLIAVVWGNEPPTTAAHQIHKIVGSLRKLLGPGQDMLKTDGASYRIEVPPGQLDLKLFDMHLARARSAEGGGPAGVAQELRAAISLCRGPALAGPAGPVLDTAALVLDDRRLTAMEQLAGLTSTHQDAQQLIGELTKLVAENPLRELLRAQLMLALYRVGRQSDALAAYEDGRRVLGEDLGINPGEQLTRLHLAILRGEKSLDLPVRTTTRAADRADGADRAHRAEATTAPAAPAVGERAASTGRMASGATAGAPDPDAPREPGGREQAAAMSNAALPYDISDFSGRFAELSALSTIVPEASRQALTIVTIDGMAGVGKTTLAIHAAHRLAASFPDGQIFLDLLGFTENQEPVEPADALHRLLRAIGVSTAAIPATLDERSALWRSQAAGRSMVLLLDNAVSSSQVRPLVPGAPGSVVLVTSRVKLTGLDGAVPVSLTTPSRSDGMAFIRKVVGIERTADAADLDEMVRICGDLPLALRITAAKLQQRPSWTVAHMVSRLRDADSGISERTDDGRSVEAAFRLSYDGLSEAHQHLFRLLGLIPCHDFGVLTAAGLTGWHPRVVEGILEDLLDARLLEQRSTNRYRFHDLLQSFAAAQARADDSSGERPRALQRFYGALVVTVRRCAGLIQPGWLPTPLEQAPYGDFASLPLPADTAQALEWLDAEWDNVLSAVRAAPRLGFCEHVAFLSSDLTYYLQLRGKCAEQAELLQLAVLSARQCDDRPSELRGQVNLFAPLWLSGRIDEAKGCAEQALTLARQLGDRTREGICLDNMGTILSNLGQYREALSFHTRALAIHRSADNHRQQAAVLLNIGLVHDALGQHGEALSAAESALSIARVVGGESREVIPLINIGVAQAELGRLEDALATLDKALAAATRVGMPRGVALSGVNVAEVLRRQGRLAEALQRARVAESALGALDAPSIRADLYNVVGQIHADRGEIDEAAAAQRACLALARALRDRRQIVKALRGLAAAEHAHGEVQAAAARWQEALALATESDLPHAQDIAEELISVGLVPATQAGS